jgi:hypothetical protein
VFLERRYQDLEIDGPHHSANRLPEANDLVVRLVRLDLSHQFVQLVRQSQGQHGQAFRRIDCH